MPTPRDYATEAPSRAFIDTLPGAAVVEFGTDWCGFCRAAEPLIHDAFASHPGVQHLKVEDGPGRKLGRSFGVKLWPTLIFLREGREVVRLVRPTELAAIRAAFRQIDPQTR